MLKPKKKLTKKEMKVDPLISTYTKFTNFYYNNKKYISYATTGLVVIIIAIIFYVNNIRKNNEIAAAELGKIFHFYDQGDYQSVINGQPEKGIKGLKSIVDEYGGSKSGNLARYYLANSYYMIGETDQALEEFNNVSLSDHLLQASAYAGIAACYERKGNNLEAAKYYYKAADEVSDQSQTPEYLNLAAKNYGTAGEKTKAVDIFKRIKNEYTNHPAAREVDRFIALYSN
ncbi:MAG: tetratricopeptide repeat protein [Bacteroidetes bacterium]|nr:tetratricopeptide repeat protein [Bacteroidota bacterium]MBU1421800.1 tetratricopeptide repeat protein [Bacteroidota bacterium]MBU2636778.1 tetratricopeptide repeat protein [Bacteroidota bacterium]